MSSLVHDKETGKQLLGNPQMSLFQLMVFCRSLYPFWSSHLVSSHAAGLHIQQVFSASASFYSMGPLTLQVFLFHGSSCSAGLLIQQVFLSCSSSHPVGLLIPWVSLSHMFSHLTCLLIQQFFSSSISSHLVGLLIQQVFFYSSGLLSQWVFSFLGSFHPRRLLIL